MLFFIYRLKGGFVNKRHRVWPCLLNRRIWYLSDPKFTRNKPVISPDIFGRYPKHIRRSSEENTDFTQRRYLHHRVYSAYKKFVRADVKNIGPGQINVCVIRRLHRIQFHDINSIPDSGVLRARCWPASHSAGSATTAHVRVWPPPLWYHRVCSGSLRMPGVPISTCPIACHRPRDTSGCDGCHPRS